MSVIYTFLTIVFLNTVHNIHDVHRNKNIKFFLNIKMRKKNLKNKNKLILKNLKTPVCF